MTRPANPPRPVAVWAATLVVSLQCSWLIGGGLLRLAQAAFGFSDDWFDRVSLPRPDDLVFAGLLAGTAAGVLLCQAISVVVRDRLATAIVGYMFTIVGLVPLVAIILLMAFLHFAPDPESRRPLMIGGVWSAALLAAGITMLHWGHRLAQCRYSPLPPPPAPVEDD